MFKLQVAFTLGGVLGITQIATNAQKRKTFRYVSLLLGVAVSAVGHAENNIANLLEQPLTEVLSGYAFQSRDTQQLQDDEFANPGLLWVDKGRALFQLKPENKQKSCAQCHTQSRSQNAENPVPNALVGAATHYPKYLDAVGKLVNLEQRINRCREQKQKLEPLQYESDALLSLTAYVANLSKGLPINIAIDGAAGEFFEKGKAYFYERRGQMNLACHHCHSLNYGKKLRGDTLSQGHGNAYPIYRLEWQTMGSLHRRLRFCNTGVRAEPHEFGADEYVNLELFLAWRAKKLLIETPGVRR